MMQEISSSKTRNGFILTFDLVTIRNSLLLCYCFVYSEHLVIIDGYDMLIVKQVINLKVKMMTTYAVLLSARTITL